MMRPVKYAVLVTGIASGQLLAVAVVLAVICTVEWLLE